MKQDGSEEGSGLMGAKLGKNLCVTNGKEPSLLFKESSDVELSLMSEIAPLSSV